MTRIVTGNDFALGVKLTKDKKTFEIPTGSIVKAAVVSSNYDVLRAGPVNVPPDTPGSDWLNSLVIVKFTASDTGMINKYGPAQLEIEVTDPTGIKHPSWYVDVLIVKGQIN